MENYELLANEVVLYEGVVTSKNYKGTLQLTLTSQKIIFEKEKGLFKKERELIDILPLDSVKVYNDATQVKQKGDTVEVQTVSKNLSIVFSGMLDARKFTAKIVDAVTDLWFGNIIDHSKGGNRKYYRWILRMMVPYSILAALLFCVPIKAGQIPALIYACVTNILLSAVCGTLMGTPMSAVMVVRTNSQSERESMGVCRAVGAYGSGMVIAILTIPITNALGGNQNAWIKYGFIMALLVLLMLSICYMNGRKAKLVDEVSENDSQDEEEAIP